MKRSRKYRASAKRRKHVWSRPWCYRTRAALEAAHNLKHGGAWQEFGNPLGWGRQVRGPQWHQKPGPGPAGHCKCIWQCLRSQTMTPK
jgi:hypothetical protein